MDTQYLGRTEIETTPLGFGCAGLFHLPHAADRRAVLAAALDAGIRHFDVAPMYGLGRAEAELAPFLDRHRAELTVTTKFGIKPTPVGRIAGRTQAPVRTALGRLPSLGGVLKSSGRGPQSGCTGRLLYSSAGYSVEAARRGLQKSLAALRSDYIDIFALHDPGEGRVADSAALAGYLESERAAGRIRTWGVAGDYQRDAEGIDEVLEAAPVWQYGEDIFGSGRPAVPAEPAAAITFGCLGQAIPRLKELLHASPEMFSAWSDRLGTDLREPDALAALLLQNSLQRNGSGVTLFTTTKTERVHAAADAASRTARLSDLQAEALTELAALARDAGAEDSLR